MEKNIQQILEELYTIDPELKKHEIEIARMVDIMMKNKPRTQFDENFARELKSRVLEKFSEERSGKSIFSFFNSRLVYAISGAVLTLAIAIPVVYLSQGVSYSLSSKTMKNSFNSGTQVVQAEKNAFGPLQPLQNVSGGEVTALNATAVGMGGDTMDKRMATSLIYPPMVVNNYNFIYDGEMPQLEGTIEVLKREASMDAAKQYGSVLQKLSLGLLNLGGLRQPYVQSFSLAEDRDEGYQVNIDAVSGSVSIMQNYTRWMTISARPIECGRGDGECVDPNRVTMEQIPEDEKLIEISNAFLKKYGIDMSSYGPGTVETGWKIGYEAAEDKNQFYIPNIQNVVYQFMINGKPVYEEFGDPMGIRVGINVINMKVVNVDGMITKTFSASAYDGETDEERVRAILKKGKMAVYADAAPVEVKVEEAKVGYMRKWQYNQDTGMSYELFVPAFIFSIKDVEELRKGGLYQSNIVIPLASEMLAELEKQIDEPIHILPTPFDAVKPMSEPAVEPRG